MLSRLVDALFFAIDQQCEVPELRNTGVIEPLKFVWFSMKLGTTQDVVSAPTFSLHPLVLKKSDPGCPSVSFT